jgi:probable HAF family extracellular repeat protein
MAYYKITVLGSPSEQTGSGDQAFGLNSLGAAVGLAYVPEPRAVIWNPGPVKLPLLGPNSVALAVNDSGQIVGAWMDEYVGIVPTSGPHCQAFVYRNGEMQDLASVFGAIQSVAADINEDGLIAAWAYPGTPLTSCHAYLYNSETGTAPTDLGFLPGHTFSGAVAINNKGHVVGISSAEPVSVPPIPGEVVNSFLYDGALNDLGPNRFAYDINDHGDIVGDWLVSGASTWTAFLCETSTPTPQFTDLGLLKQPGFVGSVARGINNHGDIVGYSYTTSSPRLPKMYHAFLRPGSAGGPADLPAEKMVDLNDLIPPNSGWLLHWASAINDKRQIVGTGTYNGDWRAYLLTPLRSDLGYLDDLDVLLTEILLRAPTTSSPGLVVQPSGKKIPVYPWGGPVDPLGPFRRLTPPQRDMLVGLAMNVLASNITDPEARRIAEIGGLDAIRLTVDRRLGELGKFGA